MKKQFRSVVCAIGLLSGTLPAIAAGPHAFNGVKAGSGLSEPMSVQQQKKQIKGIVNDANGEPVIGATVLEKGTTNGTMTDIDGNFELSVSNGAVLQISYVGYVSQEITVGSNTSFNISLKEDSQLIDEVVVVGFGSQKKANLTGAVSTVDAEVFEERPVMNAVQALQGAIPGLNIVGGTGELNRRADINIRGVGTIGDGSSGSPLILIDGMEGDLNLLNPQDIESVTVLKDAAASSIYGSRAPFGVILVTTKSGKDGKMRFNYNNSFRWSSPTRRPHVVDSYRFAKYFNEASENAGQVGHFSPEHLQRIKDYQDGKITTVNIPNPNNPSVWADGYDYANGNTDWYDEIYDNNSFAQEHTATMSGGSEKIQMYASLNYLNSKGLLKINKDKYERYATNLKVNAQATSYMDMSYNLKYSRSEFDAPSRIGIGSLGYQTWPTLPVYDDNGFLFSAPSPLQDLREGGRQNSTGDRLSQQLRLNIRPLKGWEIIGEVNYAISRTRNHQDYQKTYNHNVAGDIIPNGNSTSIDEQSYSNDYINASVYSTYEHSFNEDHNFKIMGGVQYEGAWNNDFKASRNGIMVPGMDVIDITNGTDGNGNITPPSVGGSRTDWAVAGYFGRLNYDYKGRYLAEVNVRYDGTSRFRADNRWKVFPSFSLGWNIAQEDFWEAYTDYVNTLKLRGSYGTLGNQNTSGLYPTYLTMPVGTANSGWLLNGKKGNTASAAGLVSSTMTWETIENVNVGFDAGALNNRLNVSFDWFQRNTKNMVGPAPELPLVLGVGVPKANNTDLRTRGWEITVNWKDNINKDMSYSVGFNLSDDQTEITNYPNENYSFGSPYWIGKKLGEIWGYETKGLAKTDQEMKDHLATLPNGGQDAIGNIGWKAGDIMYKDLNGDGKIDGGANTLFDHGDKTILGNNTPRYRFALNLGFTYKNFDISTVFQGVMKRDFWEGNWNFWGWTGWLWRSTAYEEHMDYFRGSADHWMGQNLDAYYPRPLDGSSQNMQVQSRYIQNAAYIRMKNLQVGYTLPRTVTDKMGISGLRFFFSGENLFVISGVKKQFDPEAMGYGTSSIGYPIQRVFSGGLSVTL
ncbi:SusC/RagA family TonB-linked outer membrane protein [Parabacteroides goldsteinii]|uniref:SusC/RagA family TonB-linked outer membrane protein n=1 Tax=Parabacteroides goldsteinii TaxID=328812 RepID=UPI002492AA30|nr:TonB-dependent receptor [Parabacteroides goldsteinii]